MNEGAAFVVADSSSEAAAIELIRASENRSNGKRPRGLI